MIEGIRNKMNIIDKAISTCDSPYVKNDSLKGIIKDLENLAARIQSVADRADDKDSPSLKRSVQDIKEIANQLRLYSK